MIFKFFGGAQEVGRSAIMLKDERSLMLDFGVKIEKKMEYPASIPRVDGMILSHAHLDHSGFTPGMYSEEHPPIFGTLPTLRLSNLLLDDALSIAKKNHTNPRFHKQQVKAMIDKFIALDYGHTAHLGNFDITLYDAGHICGSSITLVERAKAKSHKRIVYTGDFKLEPQLLHNGAEIVKSDILITESTYAEKEHMDKRKTTKEFIEQVNETLDNGGNVLLPVFAVGRSQEILTLLHKNGLASSTYIDGMAKEATSIVSNFPKFISNHEELAKAIREVNWISEHSERKGVLDEPSIILTTSGMLTGGPVLNYIGRLNKNSSILLTGFQQEGTNGRTLIEKGYVTMEGQKKKIDTPVTLYDFSAHAGKSDLYEYVRKSSPSVVICVHGDKENAKSMAESLRLEGYEAYAPKIGDTIKIGE
jgi:putative mRNA 3-end processing factor